MINIKVAFLTLCMLKYLTKASHLNSVMMSSKPLGSNGTHEVVEVTIYASYRRDYISTQICNDAYIATGGVLGYTFNIKCDVGCGTSNPIVASTIVKCTSYSILNNWSMGIVYIFSMIRIIK
jgi:hypothetical protein